MVWVLLKSLREFRPLFCAGSTFGSVLSRQKNYIGLVMIQQPPIKLTKWLLYSHWVIISCSKVYPHWAAMIWPTSMAINFSPNAIRATPQHVVAELDHIACHSIAVNRAAGTTQHSSKRSR